MAIYLSASTEYEDVDPVTAMAHANANTLLGVIIETQEALENVEDILILGIDLALVGHQDLTQSLGIPGQYEHPRLRAAESRVRALCEARGIASAGAVTRPESIQTVVESGAQYLLYGTDLVMLRREAQRAAAAVAPLKKESNGP
jgi:2-dehydro-3-deoxyglucarate aldolase/4-hydroxy-2-oxoheptanedioate aldolase